MKNNYEDMAEDVYEGMKILRDDFDCIDGKYFLLPTMEEMFGDDLLEERFRKLDETGKSDAKDAAYAAKGPFSTELGYHNDKGAFVLKLNALVLQEYMFALNRIDGDTIEFNIDYIDDGGKGFTKDNVRYNGFKDYCKKNNLGNTLIIRNAFINTPEIPHFEVQPILKGSKSVKTMTLSELKKLKDNPSTGDVTYLKYDTNKKSSVKERNGNKKVKVYEQKIDGKYYYREIINDKAPSGAVQNKNSNYDYVTVVAVDESEKKNLLGGYKAQSMVKKYLQKGTSNNDIYLVVDSRNLVAKPTSGSDYSFNNWWYSKDAIKGLVKDWKTSMNDIPFSNLDYSPYGVDKYGRFIGTVYLKNHANDAWTNLSKAILSDEETKTEHNPDYTGSPELESLGGGLSSALQGWSYDKNNYRFVDIYADMQESYDKKINLHKELTGIDFNKREDCTVMIGDVLLTIPPTSIKNTSVLTYEKKDILRGKGSMNKEQNREQILELELYFYNQAGINGIPYETSLPNGDTVTYYMNGLRSLIAQFKVAPFLPIENGYINDVLCIEAVSLESIQTINVEEFPGLVKVILTLRDFNYRVYMSDLPIDDSGFFNYAPPGKNDGDEKKEEEKNKEKENKNKNATKEPEENTDLNKLFVNIFAKIFDWELFRYYYQRSIMKGETTSTLEYGNEEYLNMIYDNKNVLQRASMCSSNVSFYVPDPEWLENALKVKKDRDRYKESLADVKLDESTLKYMNCFGDLYDSLNALNQLTSGGFDTDQEGIPKYIKKYYSSVTKLLNSGIKVGTSSSHKNIFKSSKTGLISTKHTEKDIVSNYLQPIFEPVINEIEKSATISYVTVDEKIEGSVEKGQTVKYTLNCKIDESRLSRDQVEQVYESIRKNGDADEESFKDGVLKITFSMISKANGDLVHGSSGPEYDGTNSLTLDSSGGFSVLKNLKNNFSIKNNQSDDANNSVNDNQNSEMKNKYQDYRNPKAMEFIPYVEYVPAVNFSVILQNTFTKMYLKSVDGYAPQYVGGQDTIIELQFITNDSVIASLLNNLPSVSVSTVKKFRRILSSYPLRIKNSMLQMMGINEVVVEQADVETVEDAPGLYEINLRLLSVDRTVREREALKKVGQGETSTNNEYKIRQYFELDKVLSKVDLYPDLDIPSLEELSEVGFEFSKYYLNNDNDRSYPDPDFYMIYNYMYTSALLKTVVQEALSTQLSKEEDHKSSNFQLALEDVLGMKMIASAEDIKDESSKSKKSVVKAKDANEITKDATKQSKDMITQINKNEETAKKTGKITEEQKHDLKMTNILLYMFACDIQKGWTIKNGWVATKCEKKTNDALKERINGSINKGVEANTSEDEKNKENKKEISSKDQDKINAYTKLIERKRRDAIVIIDQLLETGIKDAPINPNKLEFEHNGWDTTPMQSTKFAPYIEAVNNVFNTSVGKELLNILCPLKTSSKLGYSFGVSGENAFSIEQKDVFLRYIAGFLYASACAISGEEAYSIEKSEDKWCPRLYVENKKGEKIPFAKVKNTIKNDTYARSIKSAYNDGVCIGPFLIKRYTRDELIEIFKYDPVFTLYSYKGSLEELMHGAMYKKDDGKIYRNGFMDRYYNHQGWTSKKGKEYRANVLFSERYSAEAFLRIVLLHLRKLIIEGVIISEADVIAEDFENIKKDLVESNGAITDKITNIQGEFVKDIKDLTPEEINSYILEQTLEFAPESLKKSFCARMIYPFMSAITDCDPSIMEMILSDDNSKLDAITSNPLVGQSKNTVFDKFMAALVGINMFSTKKKDSNSNTSIAQKIMSSYGKTVYISASNDPKQYIMHSFYDMLINDKRGRLVRAFPTYYLLFIDEGREIGLWRLFDNFYSMSAISDMTITKSRKNPTDICSFSMNNMFDSYSDTYSDATTQQYMDMYGVKDVFTSIFAPNVYIKKEDMLRKRQILPDTTVMKPGVRTHVRIGYGGDASKLPIVFNGKIAEVTNGDVMEIVAQGDGNELTNPLNVFGELEAQSLIEAQDTITLAKDLRGSFARGGLHPRELMSEILTAKHGGVLKTTIKDISDGQFYNDNPFGIYHFGDHKFKEIFEAGEPVQNLYEVFDDSNVEDESLKVEINDSFANATYELKSPTINTTLQDKTAWQILEMCANSGLDYIGAIRDFGLRSTVFLGRPNDYYAYEYKKVDDVILEKRKPFQQFHYYNSYTDIIYNSITASEMNMKTNAVGTWQSSDWLWGRDQATVGPIYLDMNIYPEYQKSMTVDTGLMAAGNGAIDIPAIQRFLEKTSTSSIKGNRVNKTLAEMITTNCLKNSVKDMYTGELCIIGDPSVKPYDRVGLDDTYEDMSGKFEVETVIHNLNAETGFTTTIIPDVIVKQNGSREVEREAYERQFLFSASACITSRCALMAFLSTHDSKIIRAVAKSSTFYGLKKSTKSLFDKLSDAAGLGKYIVEGEDGKVLMPRMKKFIEKMGKMSVLTSVDSALIHSRQIDEMLGLLSKNKLSPFELSKLYELSSSIDINEYKNSLQNILKDTTHPNAKKEIQNLLNVMDTLDDVNIEKTILQGLDVNDFVHNIGSALNSVEDGKDLKQIKNALEKIKEFGSVPDASNTKELMKEISTILSDKDLKRLIEADKGLEEYLIKLGDSALDVVHDAEKFPDGVNLATLLSALKNHGVSEDLLTDASIFTVINPVTLAIEAMKMLLCFCVFSNVKAYFNSWLKNIQALCVYPLEKNMRPMTAGMNGTKGALVGYPPDDPYNSIQGMVIQLFDKYDSNFFGSLLLGDIINLDLMHKVLGQYKSNLGITEDDLPDNIKKENVNQSIQDSFADECRARSYHYNAVTSKYRVNSFDTDKGKSPEYKKYMIKVFRKEGESENDVIKNIGINENVLQLYPIEDDPEIKKAINKHHDNVKKLVLVHSKSKKSLQINFESGSRVVKYTQGPGSKVFDMPLLREDALFVLKQILKNDSLKDKEVVFKSGVRINSKKTWQNTGFRFLLSSNSPDALLKAVKSEKEKTKFVNQLLFNYQETDGGISICIYPPKVKNKNKTKDGDKDKDKK